MIRIVPLLLFCFIFCNSSRSQNVTIIESQVGNPGHVMDTVWQSIAVSLGYTAGIFPQTTLDNNSFFGTTDILVVASGVNTLTANRVNTIEQFILQGGDVYLQSEYMMSFTTNQAFMSIVNNLGGGFSWIADISGDLIPMNVLGNLATTPAAVTPLSYYWYGSAGSGCSNVDPFLEYQGQYFGFVFCPGTAGIGKLVTTSDQDWIRVATPNDLSLGTNILSLLADTLTQCTSISYPLLNLGPDTTICQGDSIVLNAGTGFTSYLWQNGGTDSILTVTAAGSYYVTVNTPCNTYIDTVIVSAISCNNAPVVLFSSSDTIFCDKKCLDFTDLSTNSPTTWQWLFPGAVPASDTVQHPVNICYNAYGTFDVTLIACNSSGCDTLHMPSFITEYQLPPQPVITQSNDTLYCTPASSYAWYNTSNPGTIISTDSFYTSSSGGSFFVIVGDSLGCQNSSVVFNAVGMTEFFANEDFFEVYPDPSGEFILISFQKAMASSTTIRLVHLTGQVVYEGLVTENPFRINTKRFSAGIYLMEITSGTKNSFRKLLINH